MCGRRQDRLQPDAHHSFQCIAAGAGWASCGRRSPRDFCQRAFWQKIPEVTDSPMNESVLSQCLNGGHFNEQEGNMETMEAATSC